MSRKPSAPKKLTPFERETERRRREMKQILSGRVSHIPNKLLKTFIRQGVKPVIVEYEIGKPIHLTKQYPTRRNPFREMARQRKLGAKAKLQEKEA